MDSPEGYAASGSGYSSAGVFIRYNMPSPNFNGWLVDVGTQFANGPTTVTLTLPVGRNRENTEEVACSIHVPPKFDKARQKKAMRPFLVVRRESILRRGTGATRVANRRLARASTFAGMELSAPIYAQRTATTNAASRPRARLRGSPEDERVKQDSGV